MEREGLKATPEPLSRMLTLYNGDHLLLNQGSLS
jgi:hypothetical protein